MATTLRDDHLQVLWISRIDYLKNSGVKIHHHEFFQMLYVVQGTGTIQIDEQSFELIPEHYYLIPNNISHTFIFTEDATTIDFKFHIYNKQLQDYFRNNSTIGICGASLIHDIKKVFNLSINYITHPNTILPYRIDIGLKGIILSIIEQSQFTQTQHPLVTDLNFETDFPIVEYLVNNLKNPITLDDIAKHFSFHPHYLIELFRKKLGTTPMQYLQVLRIEKAKEYLEFSSYPVREIADLVGLSAPYFSRLFREKEGMSPSKYREQTITVIGKDIVLEQDSNSFLGTQPKVQKVK